MTDQRVPPYSDPVRAREELVLKTYQYRFPFNYPNVEVDRRYHGGEFHGVELLPVAGLDVEKSPCLEPSEGIIVQEEEPIVRVVVIGSACTPPGYVTLEAEPCEDFRRNDEIAEVMPVRFRVDNLWGMHLRYDQWAETEGGRPLPASGQERFGESVSGLRCTSREFPLSGMSCAVFEIPGSSKVRISGGGAIAGWTDDNAPDDCHYSFRIIRTTVAIGTE